MQLRTKIVLSLLILTSFILSALIYDSNEQLLYDNPTNLQKIALSFHDDSFTMDDFTNILQVINDFDFLLERRIVKQDNDNNNYTAHYFSFISIEDYTKLNIRINAKNFLENDQHQFYLLSTYLNESTLFGSYLLYYTNEIELNKFIKYLDLTIPEAYC